MSLELIQFNFLTTTISNNILEFYDPELKALGVFGITNDMVSTFGTNQTYFEDLENALDPLTDFRFNKLLAFSFILEASSSLTIIDSELELFVRALTPYVGIDLMQQALDDAMDLLLDTDDLSNKISLLCSKLATRTSNDYLYFLINTSKHNYFISR